MGSKESPLSASFSSSEFPDDLRAKIEAFDDFEFVFQPYQSLEVCGALLPSPGSLAKFPIVLKQEGQLEHIQEELSQLEQSSLPEKFIVTARLAGPELSGQLSGSETSSVFQENYEEGLRTPKVCLVRHSSFQLKERRLQAKKSLATLQSLASGIKVLRHSADLERDLPATLGDLPICVEFLTRKYKTAIFSPNNHVKVEIESRSSTADQTEAESQSSLPFNEVVKDPSIEKLSQETEPQNVKNFEKPSLSSRSATVQESEYPLQAPRLKTVSSKSEAEVKFVQRQPDIDIQAALIKMHPTKQANLFRKIKQNVSTEQDSSVELFKNFQSSSKNVFVLNKEPAETSAIEHFFRNEQVFGSKIKVDKNLFKAVGFKGRSHFFELLKRQVNEARSKQKAAEKTRMTSKDNPASVPEETKIQHFAKEFPAEISLPISIGLVKSHPHFKNPNGPNLAHWVSNPSKASPSSIYKSREKKQTPCSRKSTCLPRTPKGQPDRRSFEGLKMFKTEELNERFAESRKSSRFPISTKAKIQASKSLAKTRASVQPGHRRFSSKNFPGEARSSWNHRSSLACDLTHNEKLNFASFNRTHLDFTPAIIYPFASWKHPEINTSPRRSASCPKRKKRCMKSTGNINEVPKVPKLTPLPQSQPYNFKTPNSKNQTREIFYAKNIRFKNPEDAHQHSERSATESVSKIKLLEHPRGPKQRFSSTLLKKKDSTCVLLCPLKIENFGKHASPPDTEVRKRTGRVRSSIESELMRLSAGRSKVFEHRSTFNF